MKSTLLLTSVFEAWQLRAAFDLAIHFLYTEALLLGRLLPNIPGTTQDNHTCHFQA